MTQPFQILPSGRKFYYFDPDGTDIVVEDLRITLSRRCRWAGAIAVHVVTHLGLGVELCRVYGYDAVDAALVGVHDVHEGPLGDIVTPHKNLLVGYKEQIEEPWERRMHQWAGLPWPVPEERQARVRHVDLRCRVIEPTGKSHHALRLHQEELNGGPATDQEMQAWRTVARMDSVEQWSGVVLPAIRKGAMVWKQLQQE